jgi:hypothetical protein
MTDTAISFILSNPQIVLFLVAVATTILKLRRARLARRVATPAYVLWGEVLFYVVGFGMIYAGLAHAYLQGIVAPSIGWQPSPFEYELGWLEIGLGVVALMSLRRGAPFRLAATIVFAIFSLAAAVQHIELMVYAHNRAPGNAGFILWFGDIALPLLVIVLAWLSRDADERVRVTHF